MAPEARGDRLSPLALIALLLLVLLVLAVFFVSFLIAPLAILVLFYVAFAASDRPKRAAGTRASAPEPLAAAEPEPGAGSPAHRAAREAELRRTYRARAEQEAARRPLGD